MTCACFPKLSTTSRCSDSSIRYGCEEFVCDMRERWAHKSYPLLIFVAYEQMNLELLILWFSKKYRFRVVHISSYCILRLLGSAIWFRLEDSCGLDVSEAGTKPYYTRDKPLARKGKIFATLFPKSRRRGPLPADWANRIN